MKPKCRYCHKKTKLITGKKLYPRYMNLWKKYYYICEECNAWTGCHPGSRVALGFPAKKELRLLRKECHNTIDPHWMHGNVERKEVYERIAKFLKIDIKKCHIAQFDENTCKKIIKQFKGVNSVRKRPNKPKP